MSKIIFGLHNGENLDLKTLSSLEKLYASLQRLESRTVTPNVYQASPTDPTGTTSTTGVMMGLRGSITPSGSGYVQFMLSGNISNDTATDGATVRLRYGIGSAPANGAVLQGTTIARALSFTLSLAGQKVPFCTQGLISGLVVGTTYWIDASVAAVTGGTATITMLSLSAVELRH
jgi:hypothetical protein